MRVEIAKPYIGAEERAAVLEVLESGQLVQGRWVEQFEQAFGALVSARHAIATSNGSTALSAALFAHGIGPGDEVIVPSFSFFATASSVLSVGATPVFADIEPLHFTLDPVAAERAITPRTRAVIPVHLFGHPCQLDAFRDLCRRRRLILVEDAAQAHLAEFDGARVGASGTVCFSFHASKNATTGEGGMVTTDDDRIADRIRKVRNQGMQQRYLHEMIGFNFRMTNLCAAIGLPQLARLESWTDQRARNAEFYDDRLAELSPPSVHPRARHVYHQYTLLAPEGRDRDAIVAQLHEQGVGARVYYARGIHQQPVMAGRPHDPLPVTESLSARVFSIPVHPFVSEEERAFVARVVEEACKSPLR